MVNSSSVGEFLQGPADGRARFLRDSIVANVGHGVHAIDPRSTVARRALMDTSSRRMLARSCVGKRLLLRPVLIGRVASSASSVAKDVVTTVLQTHGLTMVRPSGKMMVRC
jgi:hypothetical protein